MSSFPDSLVVLPLLVAFGMSMWLHYRAIGPAGAPAFGWAFFVGCAALLSLFGFVVLMMLAPGWAARKPAFLGLGALLIAGAYGVRRWGMAPPKPSGKLVPLGQLSPGAQPSIVEQRRNVPAGKEH